MEIRAYNELYLEDAMSTLGAMTDYAVNYCGMTLGAFMDAFLRSDVAEKFERGDPDTVAGKSAVELYRLVMPGPKQKVPDYFELDRSPEYWFGWALAYCQWYLNKSFRQILDIVSAEELLSWYPVYHEMDISQVVDSIRERLRKKPTKLEQLRRKAGYSQSQLAQLSTVSLRSIQMYEQRHNDITRAQYNILAALAKVLRCKVDDLVEGE